jgi:hypothetical protein
VVNVLPIDYSGLDGRNRCRALFNAAMSINL